MINTVYPDSNMSSSLSFVVIIVLVALLQLRQRKVRPWKLFIAPIFLFILTAIVVQNTLFLSYLSFAIISVGFVLGVVIGIALGSFMKVKVDEESGTIFVKGSVIAVILWVTVILLKIYGEQFVNTGGYIALNVLTAMILMLTLGTMLSRNIFIYLKYRNVDKSAVNTSGTKII